MSELKKIKTIVDGVEVEGEITHRSESDLQVSITKPYQKLSKGCHIPYFARPHRSFDGEYGDKLTTCLLNELYHIGDYLEAEMDRLKVQLSNTKKEISQISAKFSPEEGIKKKKELKRQFKNGEIDSKVYQAELKSLRKKIDEYNSEVFQIMDSFFESNFPMIITISTRVKVIEIIEGNKDLKPSERKTSEFFRIIQ